MGKAPANHMGGEKRLHVHSLGLWTNKNLKKKETDLHKYSNNECGILELQKAPNE